MPTAHEILQRSTIMARDATAYAIAWHVVVGMALAAVYGGWRPRIRVAMFLLVAPIASAVVLAYVYGNTVNGLVLAVGATALVTVAPRGPSRHVTTAPIAALVIGLALIAFGWSYPHFVDPVSYAYAAPLGVLPSPTLAVAIGFTIVGGGLHSKAWSTILSLLGLAYGTIGVVWLGVWIDTALVAGAAALMVQARRLVPPPAALAPCLLLHVTTSRRGASP